VNAMPLIDASTLAARIGTPFAPHLLDVRRREAFDTSPDLVPGARWCDHRAADTGTAHLPAGAEIVVYCAQGHALSQGAVAGLRARGIDARCLAGGIEAYRASGAPRLAREALPERWARGPTRWVTRGRPKVDRVACPWLVRRFIDPDAEILFVAAEEVEAVARELDAEPFDIPGAALSHDGERCSFDAFLARFGLREPALEALATIVRAADTGRPELGPQAPGLLAMSLGLCALHADDHAVLERGFVLYDALLAWLRSARHEAHGWPPGG
jgi:rhodanese-related sulfurtransferase